MRAGDLFNRKGESQFFAIVIVSAALSPDMVTALRALEPSVMQIVGDYTIVLTKLRNKLLDLDDCLKRYCNVRPIDDYLLFEEFNPGVLLGNG